MPNIDSSLLRRAAAEAAGGQHYASSTLYVVATPIGNLADIGLRALHVLERVELVACEDTRVTAQLLSHYGLDKPLRAVHAHNEAQAAAALCGEIAAGASAAFVSDAGVPGLSDPGARLVAAATQRGLRVVPVPGPSAALAALSVAGDLHGEGFVFVGFLPPRGGERRAAMQHALADMRTLVVYEAPHRIEVLAAELAAAAPTRGVTIARELTKRFETIATMTAAALPAWLAADANRTRGEFVVVVHALPSKAMVQAGLPAEVERCLRVLLRELPLKQAVGMAAEITAAPRNALYELALRWRDEAADAS